MGPKGVLDSTMPGKLKQELKQTRPFTSAAEELVLALVRTADQLVAPLTERLRAVSLSLSQYNILRILRGAGDQGLTCGDISERMVRRDPDLTRLLDRLEKRELVARERSAADRRVVLTTLTPAGRALLDSLDHDVESTVQTTLQHMTPARIQTLIDLLEEARGERQLV